MPASQTPALIPASNFTVQKVVNLRVTVPGGYILLNGWGMRDIDANAWVSMCSEQYGVTVPTLYHTRKIARLAVSEGLYNGYQRVSVAA